MEDTDIWQRLAIDTAALDALAQQLSLYRLAVAGGLLLAVLVLRRLITRGVLRGLERWAGSGRSRHLQAVLSGLTDPLRFLILVAGLFVAVKALGLPLRYEAPLLGLVRSLGAIGFFWMLYALVEPLVASFDHVTGLFGKGETGGLRQFVSRGLKTVVVVMAGIAILQEWGINVAAFLGGLGLVGMAAALAAKDTLANIFGGLTIFADRAFQEGDWIETPAIEGTVEVIGLRTTKIRTFSKAVVTVPNAALVDNPITNWSRMTHRRVRMTLGLEYRTTAQQLARILERLRGYLAGHDDIAQENVAQMVHINAFGPSSIDIDLYYFTTTTDWARWREIRSRNIVDFKRIVEEEGAAFAFPSRSLYVETVPEPAPSPRQSALHG